MKLCIYGAGAVGGIMAAWLERAGHDVSLVARGAHLEAIRSKGLRIRTVATGAEITAHPRADADPAKLGRQDAVIITVKGQSLPEVAAGIGPLLGPDTSIVTAMNGIPWWFFDKLPYGEGKLRLDSLDPGARLRAAMPTPQIVGCVIHCAASVPEPGLISHTMGQKLIVGEPGGNTARTAAIGAAFSAAGYECIQSPFIQKDFWVKLLGNISFNPVSALTMASSDRMIADPYVKAYMVAVMRECLAIGRAVGVDADIDPEARIDMARALGKFKTSMLQDMEAGKALEIDGLLTGTLDVARQAGVPAPHTESLLGLIRLRAETSGQYRRPGA